ncbi:GNAT family acetyltransferase [Blastomonas sp.]|uniref:GNAT family acetyltransferase n=1 Tax=Blastomonas sp. TaxID=1909299 RepID=UPI002637C18A|nr:GNAT family acetyltransferase [Blastomonas sp.]MDM7956445.1 GNAT family acetyltransferase [Blastomonas sp.]
MTIRRFDLRDFAGVEALWNACFPDDPPHSRAQVAIPQKLAFQPELFWVAIGGERVIGSIMAGYDGHRGWLYSVAVLPGEQGHGLGARLVRTAEDALRALGCTKVNLQVRDTNKAVAGFYAGLGYAEEPRISMGRWLQD